METSKKYPTSEEKKTAKKALKSFPEKTTAKSGKKDTILLKLEESEETFEIPSSVFHQLREILKKMADGKSMTLIENRRELTTQQAADYLQISRPHLVKLLESGLIPFHKVGNHRRVDFDDLKKYQDNLENVRRKNLKELAKQAQEEKMGY